MYVLTLLRLVAVVSHRSLQHLSRQHQVSGSLFKIIIAKCTECISKKYSSKIKQIFFKNLRNIYLFLFQIIIQIFFNLITLACLIILNV